MCPFFTLGMRGGKGFRVGVVITTMLRAPYFISFFLFERFQAESGQFLAAWAVCLRHALMGMCEYCERKAQRVGFGTLGWGF